MTHVLLQRFFSFILAGGLMIIGAQRGQTQLGTTATGARLADRYSRLDRFARQLPEAQAGTMSQLTYNLAVAAHSDDDKARLIFAWLAYHVHYDTECL